MEALSTDRLQLRECFSPGPARCDFSPVRVGVEFETQLEGPLCPLPVGAAEGYRADVGVAEA